MLGFSLISHPLLLQTRFRQTHFALCDLFSGFSDILSSMMKRETGSKTLRSERVLSRGDPNFNGNRLKHGLCCSELVSLFSGKRGFYLSVKSNLRLLWLCITTLNYWLKNISFIFSTNQKQRQWQTKTQCCGHKCFPVCPRAQHLLRTQNLCPRHKNVSDFFQKHFVSATNVSRFAQHRNNHEQQCVRNIVSSFATILKPDHIVSLSIQTCFPALRVA